MINTISSLVRYIVILLFLTVILEMILPQGIFRRYLRVLVGILLIFTVLSPLQKIMHIAPLWNEDTFLPETEITSSSLDEVLAKGEKLHKENLQLALQDYRSNIFTLLENELAGKFDKKLLQLDFTLDENSSSEEFGTVKELSLIIQDNKETRLEKQETIKVQKVSIKIHHPDQKEEISPSKLSDVKEAEIRAEESAIERYLASFLQLSLKNVKVKIIQ